MTRHDGRATDQLRDVTITRGWLDHAEGSVLVEFGRTRVLCAASFTEGVPRWRKGSGAGLGDRRVRDAAAGHQHPFRPRVGQGPDRRPHPRDLPARRPQPARGGRHEGAWGRTRSCWTATSCRPTAAPAPRRSPAPTSRSPTPIETGRAARAIKATAPAAERLRRRGQRRRRRRRGRARPGLRRGLDRRHRHERRDDRRRAVRRGAGHRRGARRSAARPSARCSTWPPPAAPS